MQSWFTFDPKLAERFQDLFAAIMVGLGGTLLARSGESWGDPSKYRARTKAWAE